MSRLCVKNLPKYVAEDRLREFFSQKGEVTDAKLMRTSDGKSRQFGFVGFRTEREAEEAIKYFDKSFMDSSCIVCEIARKIGDPNIPRPWSRHTLKKQEKLTNEDENAKVNKSSKSAGLKGDKKNIKQESKDEDPQLQEFLEVMQPRSKSKLWANDALTAPSLSRSKKLSCADSSLPLSHPCRILQKCTNFGVSNTHPSIFLKSPGNIGKKDGDKQSQGKEINQEKMDTDDELDEVFKKEESLSHSEKSEKLDGSCNDEVMTDTDYLKSRVRKDWSDSESTEDDSSDNESDAGGDKNSEDANADNILEPDDTGELLNDGFSRSNNESLEPADPSSSVKNEKEEDLESGRLFVRNLPYTTTEEELEEHFRAFGNVSQVHIVVDKDSKRSKGIAFVLYALPESAARALAQLDSSIFQGRLLHVMPAKQKISPVKTETVANTWQSSNTFKQQRQEEKKASEASGNTQSWNTLFMRPDTVVENIARKFGVSKSDLLDREADDLAVRIALGETQVIAETKKALAKSGVNIASLEEYAAGKTDGVKRSNYVILVKNLPYGSSEGELASMFGKFGSVDKIILPSTKTLALVVFLEPAEARAAFRGLAYKRFKDTPLYLEWAPGNILDQTSDSKNDLIVEDDAKRVLLEQQVEGVTDPESPSLYVKNLNFKTSDESLKEHFTNHIKDGRILGVRVKKHLKNGKNVSMGFGFVEFDSVDTAINVCKDLQGTVLDGHALILKHCHPKKDQVPKKAENGKSSTKLLVRNVAFEATKKDLTQLFSPFGQIKSLKLPVRFDGNHRGFAFVEFATKQEAKNAIEALSNTHLYMRHLVLERAKEGESLEELRARTAAQLGTEQNGFQTTKLSKKRKQMAILDEGSFKFGRIAD